MLPRYSEKNSSESSRFPCSSPENLGSHRPAHAASQTTHLRVGQPLIRLGRMIYNTVRSAINNARFRSNSFNPHVWCYAPLFYYWPVNLLATLVPQPSMSSSSDTLQYTKFLLLHMTGNQQFVSIRCVFRLEKKNTNIGWVLKIANRGINESSNTVSAILIWPAATRQSWHYPPRL